MTNFCPETLHRKLYEQHKPLLGFDEVSALEPWRSMVREKLHELIGLPQIDFVPRLEIEWANSSDSRFDETRFIVHTEEGFAVPCHLVTPKNPKGKLPVVICIQGHSNGMHISLGRERTKADQPFLGEGDRDFAIQAVKEGYAAVVMEQRAFGECEGTITEHHYGRCHQAAMQALLLGRTLIGERCHDVMRLIDVLGNFDCIDTEKIACMGNSGGGTTTYFVSCLDERIRVSMPSGYVCEPDYSIFALYHCQCNYIPSFSKYFNLYDVSCLIAPRPLVVVAGDEDPIFPLVGSKRAFEGIQKIYEKCDASTQCHLVIGHGGHRFYANDAYPIFNAIMQAL